MRLYHRMEVDLAPDLPDRAPIMALTSHFSILDTIALYVADPYSPDTTTVVKDSLMKIPVISVIVRARGLVPVSRDGRDIGPLRNLLRVMKSGRGICLAAEGQRSRTGRLGPLNKVVVKLALRAARDGIPILPVAQIGTYEALPVGAVFPRPVKVRVVVGSPIDVDEWADGVSNDETLEALARRIQGSIAGLLPPERRPAEQTPAMADVRSDDPAGQSGN